MLATALALPSVLKLLIEAELCGAAAFPCSLLPATSLVIYFVEKHWNIHGKITDHTVRENAALSIAQVWRATPPRPLIAQGGALPSRALIE